MHASSVAVGPAGESLVAEMETTAARMLSTHAGQSPGAIPGLAAARELYRAFGMDPTHTRPSSEALLRRVLQAKGLPRILNGVDLCNLCALRFLLPIGLYDAASVAPPATLRRGRPGETYAGSLRGTWSRANEPGGESCPGGRARALSALSWERGSAPAWASPSPPRR